MLQEIASKFKGMLPGSRDRPGKQYDERYKDEIIAYVKNEFIKRQSERTLLELQWRLNINNAKGNQFLKINTESNDIEEIDQFAWWEEREIFNHIAPIVETRLAKEKKLSINLKTRPATSESDDISSAKICNKILAANKKNQNMKKLQNRANVWGELTGTAVWKTVWNSSKGKVIGQIALESQEVDPKEDSSLEYFEKKEIKDGNMPAYQTIHEGDIHTTVHSPFEILPDSIWNNKEDCRKIMHAKVYNVDEIFETHGIVVEGKENNVFSIKTTAGAGVGSIGQKGFGFTVSTAKMSNSAMVYEEWELPSRRHPEGRLIICTDDDLLYYGPLPDKLGNEEWEFELPFVVQKCIDTEDSFFGECLITRLVPIQRRYNSIKNRKKEYLNRATIGNLTYEEGSIPEDFFEEEGIAPGDMVPYKAGFKPPTFMDFHNLPSTFDTEERSIEENFNRLSGVSEFSKQSMTPSGVNSGVAIAAVAEQDDTRIGLTADNIKDARVDVGRYWLKLYKNNAEFPRILRNVGENNEVEVVEFTANDITTFDVFFEAASELSETPMQRRQFVFDLLNAGLFNDPDTGVISKDGRIKIFEMLEMGDWENFITDDNLHMQKADRENLNMTEGKPMNIRDFDDDLIHIKVHNNHRLTADYENALEENQQIDMLFEAHLEMHYRSLQQKAAASAPPPEEQKEMM